MNNERTKKFALQPRGVIYTAIGERYVKEANRSIKSLKAVSPCLPVTVFTDLPLLIDRNNVEGIIEWKHQKKWRDFECSPKIENLSATPYEQTLFVDTDTYFLTDVSDSFKILAHYDLAFTHGALRQRCHERDMVFYQQNDIPYAFAAINSGFIFYNKNQKNSDFFQKWKQNYIFFKAPYDQVSLRRTLWNEKINFYVLPPEFNFVRIEDYIYWYCQPHVAVPILFHGTKYRKKDLNKLLAGKRRLFFMSRAWNIACFQGRVRLSTVKRTCIKTVLQWKP